MANHPSAKKRHRQSLKRNERNNYTRTTVRTVTKKALKEIEAGNKESSPAAVKSAVQTIDKAASKGVITKKTASRKISRLAKKANSLKAV